MNRYELVFITTAGDKTLLQSTEKLIADFNGKITAKEDWGEKRFAYKINSLSSGHYHFWKIELESQKVKELKNKLNIGEEVIRYLLLKQE